VTLGATLVTSLLATLAHPTTWMLALAGFLVRGGIVIFLLPIVVLPSPVGLANATGPTVVGFVLGGFSFDLVVLLVLAVGAVLAWIVFGGLLAATLEVEGIRIVAGDDDVIASSRAMDDAARVAWDVQVAAAPAHAFDPSRQALRVLAARMAMLFPLMATVIWASARTVAVTYAELTVPTDVATPIVWRIVAGVPDAIAIVVIVWVAGEIVGGIAARRIVLDGASIAGGLRGAVTYAVGHPLRTLVLFAVPLAALLLVVIPAGAAATVAWTGLRAALVDRNALAGAVALLVFVALWAGGLALTGAVAAWRHAAWTVDTVTHGHRTFGGSTAGHPGDWNTEGRSGTV
jgi:hypothetical protein